MTDFSPIADACFAEFGIAATYQPASGPSASVVIVMRQPDEVMDFELGRSIHRAVQIDVRASEVPAGPKEGESFATDAATYRVIGAARADSERLVWSCPAAEVTP